MLPDKRFSNLFKWSLPRQSPLIKQIITEQAMSNNDWSPYVGDFGTQNNNYPERPNHILLLTVHNVMYPITTQLLQQICSGLAHVVRIVILRKRVDGKVQAMLEFTDSADAQRVKDHLDGVNIYKDNSCKMEIHFAYNRVFRLRVPKNDDDSYDFSQPPGNLNTTKRKICSDNLEDWRPRKISRSVRNPDGPVCMIYDLNMDQASPQRLFNLLCLYGNVIGIKFLLSKAGSAMVEMETAAVVKDVIHFLSNARVFGQEMVIKPLKQFGLCLNEASRSRRLNNGYPSSMDFSQSRFNRFFTAKTAQKNRLTRPTNILHFYQVNLPMGPNVTNEIYGIFQNKQAPIPVNIEIFPQRNEKASLTGNLYFNTLEEATEALMVCNNLDEPFTLKLSFSVGKANRNSSH